MSQGESWDKESTSPMDARQLAQAIARSRDEPEQPPPPTDQVSLHERPTTPSHPGIFKLLWREASTTSSRRAGPVFDEVRITEDEEPPRKWYRRPVLLAGGGGLLALVLVVWWLVPTGPTAASVPVKATGGEPPGAGRAGEQPAPSTGKTRPAGGIAATGAVREEPGAVEAGHEERGPAGDGAEPAAAAHPAPEAAPADDGAEPAAATQPAPEAAPADDGAEPAAAAHPARQVSSAGERPGPAAVVAPSPDRPLSWRTRGPEWRLPGGYRVNQVRPRASTAALRRLVTRAARACNDSLIVVGHSCSIGTAAQRTSIAHRRAEEMAEVLASVAPAGVTLHVVSAGSAHPVASNRSVKGRARNRRVTLICGPTG